MRKTILEAVVGSTVHGTAGHSSTAVAAGIVAAGADAIPIRMGFDTIHGMGGCPGAPATSTSTR